MEQHRWRPPNDGPRRGRPPSARLPPQARRPPGGGEHGPGAGRPPRSSASGAQPANLRLTGLGSGLFCIVSMFLLGCLDTLLFGSSMTVYAVLFLLVCAVTALWVRDGDLLTAPVVLPIAFLGGLFPVADGKAGLLGRLMGVFTGLATQAGWLYGGTLVAGVIVLVRRVRWVRRRRRRS
ncbi:DUF6542 domain-containing protein [Streptomyces sp. FXJ1.172]|uniref:DUF6542 domain-containing protein n=1 Tax=Streptomyces sp. FXJ1.172 TaxID=710705 RepID=UPI0007CFEBD1|nr:DUF6542 domain-containing protein [Streptomyces sp. FXJ1.172]WEO95577.1 hypothetical protein A6P39_016965 [Streptomyces sp. FXJ1.172]